MIFESILEAIGRTPIIRLGRLSTDLGISIYVKLESLNPGGSHKARIALGMVLDAERRGILVRGSGQTIIEPSGGNTGIGLAMAGNVLVVLGATGISGNSRGKRHPTIGNRVEIGAFSRVFGNVVIGDDVFVAPHCVIKENVPRNSVVSLRSELQIVRRKIASEASDKENEYLMRNMETIQ